MLSDEGQYDELCGPNGCAEQANRFAAIFAVATLLVNGISLPSGLYLDNCGGRVMSGKFINISIFTGGDLSGLWVYMRLCWVHSYIAPLKAL